ncbi:uncharacterized protein LOC136000442 [Caloenas nicobarica]|uniref:uncharacterized protein LOC136000442 n=1 Tax=Caloenas nicobarica TaxID=187106 RepID=UPI0032B793C8
MLHWVFLFPFFWFLVCFFFFFVLPSYCNGVMCGTRRFSSPYRESVRSQRRSRWGDERFGNRLVPNMGVPASPPVSSVAARPSCCGSSAERKSVSVTKIRYRVFFYFVSFIFKKAAKATPVGALTGQGPPALFVSFTKAETLRTKYGDSSLGLWVIKHISLCVSRRSLFLFFFFFWSRYQTCTLFGKALENLAPGERPLRGIVPFWISGRGDFPFSEQDPPSAPGQDRVPGRRRLPPKSLLLERKKVLPFLHRVPQFRTRINSRNLNSQPSDPSRRRAENWNPKTVYTQLRPSPGGISASLYLRGAGKWVQSPEPASSRAKVVYFSGTWRGPRCHRGEPPPCPVLLEPGRARPSEHTENAAFPSPPPRLGFVILFLLFFFFFLRSITVVFSCFARRREPSSPLALSLRSPRRRKAL